MPLIYRYSLPNTWRRKSKGIQLLFITFVACIRGSLPSEVEEEH